jgi:hypothetical protein
MMTCPITTSVDRDVFTILEGGGRWTTSDLIMISDAIRNAKVACDADDPFRIAVQGAHREETIRWIIQRRNFTLRVVPRREMPFMVSEDEP